MIFLFDFAKDLTDDWKCPKQNSIPKIWKGTHIDIMIKLIILIHLKKKRLYSAKKNFVTYFLFKTKKHF